MGGASASGLQNFRPDPPTPLFFVNADSKGLAAQSGAKADSKGLMVVLAFGYTDDPSLQDAGEEIEADTKVPADAMVASALYG
jgi:hypothetical protein